MNNWFTITKIDNSTYAFQENHHWLRTNCYLLIGKNKCALIDTGMGVDNIYKIVKTLTDLPIIVIATHSHWDHIGGHKYFNTILSHKLELDWLRSGKTVSLKYIKNFIKTALLTPNSLPSDFNIEEYKVFKGEPSQILYGNEIIDIGMRELKIIHTPGHSPGHVSIYDIKNCFLFSGDLIYNAPITAHYTGSDPNDYYDSICKLDKINSISQIFPGHYNINLNRNMLSKVKNALEKLKDKNLLFNGSGKHCIDEITIQF